LVQALSVGVAMSAGSLGEAVSDKSPVHKGLSA